MLTLAAGLRLPVHLVTESVGILAKRRAGKSTTARRLTEQLHRAKQQVVVVDPKGDWWGLLFGVDGKSPGLPFVVLGGEHGHIKIEVGAGELVARMVVSERVSLVLDLSEFRKHEVATFMTAFMETLYRLKAQEQYRTPMMLILDEADAIAPQKPQKGEERMLGAAEDLVRRGGQRGIGVTLITQRSAVLNKNVLTQINILLILRTIAPQDLDAVYEWVKVHGTKEQGAALMASLPSLQQGTGWVWAPGWPDVTGIFTRCDFILPETFDSSATPGQQKRVEPKNAADVDLDAFKREMAATIEKAKADDPRELRKQLAEAKRMLVKQATTIGELQARPPSVETRVEVPVLRDAQIARVEKLVDRFGKALDVSMKQHAAIGESLQQLISAVHAISRRQQERPTAAPMPPIAVLRRQVASCVSPAYQRRPVVDGAAGNDGYLPPGEKATLIAAAQYPDGITREQASILTGYKRSSRDAYIQRLLGRGHVELRGSHVVATDAGVAALGADYEPLPTGEALQRYWLERLPLGEKAVLDVALTVYPEDVDVETVDARTGYRRSSRDAYIQRLVARQLLTRGRGAVRASAVLFEDT